MGLPVSRPVPVRLRGYAFAHDMTASKVAWEILGRHLRPDDDECVLKQDGES